MAAGPWLFTNNTRTYILDNTIDMDTDTFRMILVLSTSNLGAASDTYTNLTNEHAEANGYLQTGVSMTTLDLTGTTTVTVDDAADVVWTAAGGSITAKWAAIYSSTADAILCYCLLESGGADVTATTGNTLTVALHGSGIFTLA